MMIGYVFISGLAGVYTEFILKKYLTDSIFIQNIYLYIYGSLFNFIGWTIESYDKKVVFNFEHFSEGFSEYTWIIVASQSFNGILMSLVMKYSNNITKLFVTSSSMLITAFLGMLVLYLKLNIYFYIAFALNILSLLIYIV